MIVSQKAPKNKSVGLFSDSEVLSCLVLRQRVAGSVTRQILFFYFGFSLSENFLVIFRIYLAGIFMDM